MLHRDVTLVCVDFCPWCALKAYGCFSFLSLKAHFWIMAQRNILLNWNIQGIFSEWILLLSKVSRLISSFSLIWIVILPVFLHIHQMESRNRTPFHLHEVVTWAVARAKWWQFLRLCVGGVGQKFCSAMCITVSVNECELKVSFAAMQVSLMCWHNKGLMKLVIRKPCIKKEWLSHYVVGLRELINALT